MTSLLEIDQVSVRFGGVHALRDVSIKVERSTVHGLIGPNGAGKTTLLNTLSGLVRPNSGQLRFDGANLLDLPPHRIPELGVARTFQNLGLLGEQTVLENVLLGLHSKHPGTLLDELCLLWRRNAFERAARARARAALDVIGLGAAADSRVDGLSYGQRKGVELARAIAAESRLLLLDEPTAGLSESEMDELRRQLAALRQARDLTILVITHHIEFLLGVADHVTVLDFGAVIADGHPSLVRTDERVRAAYLGPQ